MSVKYYRSKSVSPTHSLMNVKDCSNGKSKASLGSEIGRRSFRALRSKRNDHSKLQVSSPMSVEHVGHVGFNAASGEYNVKGEWTNYMSVERPDGEEASQPVPIPTCTPLKKSATLPNSLSVQYSLPICDTDNSLSPRASSSRHSTVLRPTLSSSLLGGRRSPSPALRSAPTSPLLQGKFSTTQGLSQSADGFHLSNALHPSVQYRVNAEESPNQYRKGLQLNEVKKQEVLSEKSHSTSRKGSTKRAQWGRTRSRSYEQERKPFLDQIQPPDKQEIDRKMSMDSILRDERKRSINRRNRWGFIGSHEHSFSHGLSKSTEGLFYTTKGEKEEEKKEEIKTFNEDQNLRLENEWLHDECTQLRQTVQRLREDFKEKERQTEHEHQLACLRLERQLYQQREETLRVEYELRSQLHEVQQRLNATLSKTEDPASPSIDSREIDFWIVDRSEVKLGSQIGGGAWGYISKGKFRSQVVAVKLPYPQILTHHTYKRLQREVSIMAKVRHPNLLLFIAAVFDEEAEQLKAPPMIITELLDTDLRSAYTQKILKPVSKLPIFRDIARALNYLHECSEPIIHRDVSAPNVLLEALPNERWRAKVSDFGSANLVRWANTSGEGAIIYAAPETFPRQARAPQSPIFPQSTKIDVFSYGILLCEVITSRMPEPDQFDEMLAEVKSTWANMHNLIVSCISYNPADRPTMNQVLDRLNTPPQPALRKRTIK